MTAQRPERLVLNGEDQLLCSLPLEPYFEAAGDRPTLVITSTALWRGYTGHWAIVEGKLYLTALEGLLEDGSKLTLADVFPDAPASVFASWFTSELRVPQGNLVEPTRGGFGGVYERDLLMQVRDGVVVGETMRVNEPVPRATAGVAASKTRTPRHLTRRGPELR